MENQMEKTCKTLIIGRDKGQRNNRDIDGKDSGVEIKKNSREDKGLRQRREDKEQQKQGKEGIRKTMILKNMLILV